MPIDLSRRDVLRLGLVVTAGVGLAACTTASSSGTPTQTDPGGPEDPDRALRAEVSADEARLTTLYAAAAKVLTGSAATRVSGLGERHAAYRAAVAPASATTSPSESAAASGSTGASASPTVPAVTAGTALKVLVAAEAAAATSRAAQAARATDPELARVIVLAGTGAASAAAVLSAARAR